MKKGVCIALTGGIACGKSTVAAFWQRWGAQVADADVLAHELIAPHGACVDAVLKEFGAQMQAADGGVDRTKLAAVVFADAAARQRLEALLHPEVIRRMRAWVEEVRRDGLCGVGVVPLLFEVGLEKDGWDAIVCVTSSEAAVLARLAQRGLTPAEAQARIASQWPVSEKAARSDRVIENNGSLAELETACRTVWNDLFEEGDTK
jgi:dephospho-CoA kinase